MHVCNLADSAQEYFDDLKALIEDTYIKNNKTSVVLLSHSLGCPYTHHFLSNMTQDWKDTHIRVWVTIAGAWAGSAKLMRIYASGSSLGLPDVVVEPLNLRPVLRTYESSAFLLPSKDFWATEEVGGDFVFLKGSLSNGNGIENVFQTVISCFITLSRLFRICVT